MCRGKFPPEEAVRSRELRIRQYYWLLFSKLPRRKRNGTVSYSDGAWYSEGHGWQAGDTRYCVASTCISGEGGH